MRPYQEMSPEKYIQVIAHELGHHLDLSLNPNQPDPKFGSDAKPINDNEERIYNHAEIRAETFAIRLLQENGVPSREDYLKDNYYTRLSTSVQIKANEDYASHMLAVANMYVGLENPAEYTIDQISNLIHMAQQSISPLVLDLNGDGVKTTSIENGTYFDLDANGHAEKTAYIDPNDAFLVRDLNKNGQIDSGHELFGNHTLLSNGKKAANGFEALADLDSNKDGIFDAKDAAYNELFLFRDKNGNGIVDKGELISLKAAGIKSLNIAYKNSTEVDENGNKHAQQGSFTKSDGTTGKVNDVWFNANLANTKDTLNFKVTDEVKSLINIKGFGNVHDLHNAIIQDTTGRLKELVISITEGINKKQTLSSLSDQVTNLIFEWAGAAKYTSQSRGSLIDARMLYTLEAFMGQGFKQDEVGKDPLAGAGKLLKKSFQILKDYVFDQFIFTTKLAPLFNQLSYTWNAKTQKMDPNINKLLSTLKIVAQVMIICVALLALIPTYFQKVMDKTLFRTTVMLPQLTLIQSNSPTLNQQK